MRPANPPLQWRSSKQAFFLLISSLALLWYSSAITAVGIGPGTVTLDYVPGSTHTVDMIALNTIDQPAEFTVSASVDFITCSPAQLTVGPGVREPFQCTITIPTMDLPPGVHPIARVRVSEIAPRGSGQIGAVGAVESVIRVNVPNEGPYLGLSLEIPNVQQGSGAIGKMIASSAGTEPLGSMSAGMALLDHKGGEVARLPALSIGPLALGESKPYTFAIPTEQLKSAIYRLMVDVPYSGKNAHSEAVFKIGEMRLAINSLTAEPVALGGIAKFMLDTESFWGEAIPYRITLSIKKGSEEIGAVRDQLAEANPWQTQQTALFWETKTAPAGSYDAEVLLSYSGKQERRMFAGALAIGEPQQPAAESGSGVRRVLLGVIGGSIIALLLILLLLLRKHGKDAQRSR